MKKLAIITTHPIQYNAPLFKLLNGRGNIQIRVFYTWGKQVLEKKFDPGFGKNIEWDIPLLEGYDYEFVENISVDPGSQHFRGIDNPELITKIKGFRPDGILVYGWSFKSHLKVLRHFYGKVPVFFRGDSTLIGKSNGLKSRVKSLFLKWVYSHVDKALYVGTRNKEYFREFGLIDRQLVFCPHAIDNKRFMDEGKYVGKVAEWKSELNVPLLSTGFLYAGKLDDNKNVGLLLEAFTDAGENAYLVIAGNGILEFELKSKYSSNKNIFFLPFQNQQQMPVLYRMADVFVLPSLTETWGLGINEAMASGRAVLVSNTCGAAIDLVKEGANGYTFQSGNKLDLVEKMKFLTRAKEELSEMKKSSLLEIENWNYESDCMAIESLFIVN